VNDLLFRPVTPADFSNILELEKTSFPEQDQLNTDDLYEFYDGYRDGMYMLILGGALIGYIIFFIENGSGYIESIAIDNQHRKSGYGLLALRFIIRKFMEIGIARVSLHVRTDNTAAVRLYEKEGFTKEGYAEHFYTDGKPAYVYSRRLSKE